MISTKIIATSLVLVALAALVFRGAVNHDDAYRRTIGGFAQNQEFTR